MVSEKLPKYQNKVIIFEFNCILVPTKILNMKMRQDFHQYLRNNYQYRVYNLTRSRTRNNSQQQ